MNYLFSHLILFFIANLYPEALAKRDLTTPQFLELLSQAEVWTYTQPSSFNFLQSPNAEDPSIFTESNEVSCRYLQKKGTELEGSTPKFYCSEKTKGEFKLKFSPNPLQPNREVYVEAAATLLFRALGFAADRAWIVNATCMDCPEKLWPIGEPPLIGKKSFIPRVLYQIRFPGEIITRESNDGWNWNAFNTVHRRKEESLSEFQQRSIHRNALRLLAAFVLHGDNPPRQQRLVCVAKNGPDFCLKSYAMIRDLGATFGAGGPKVTIDPQSALNKFRDQPLWKDIMLCQARLTGALGGAFLQDPIVNEDSRFFLSQLMNSLSRKQIEDLFIGAQFHYWMQPKLGNKRIEMEQARKIINPWVEAFLKRRSELAIPCKTPLNP